MSTTQLTIKQEHFAQLVAKGLSGTEAAKTAGYSEKRAAVRASELLHDRKVTVRIDELKAKLTERVVEKTAIDKAWVLNELVENVRMGKQAVPVVDREGNETGDYEQNLPAANKALELIGKEIGMFIDRKEIRTGSLDLTDEQLDAALIAARALAACENPGTGKGNAAGGESAAGLSPVREAG